MGLDVYLRRYDDFEDWKARAEKADQESEAAWQSVMKGRDFKALSKAETDEGSAKSKAAQAAVGIGVKDWQTGGDEGVELIELPSKRHPKHLFKVGYFRSSYNDGGINGVLGNLLGEWARLDAIFGCTETREYYVKPDWRESLERCRRVRVALTKAQDEGRNVRVVFCDLMHISKKEGRVESANEAAEAFLAEQERYRKSVEKAKAENKPNFMGGSYSNIRGDFFMSGDEDAEGGTEGLPVLAALPGVGTFAGPGVYLVYRADLSWYAKSLEVIEETINYVLSQPAEKVEQYRLSWSG